MDAPKTPARPPVHRLIVSPEIPREVDAVRIELVVNTRQEWTKTAVNDALVRVGLRHLDEVAAELMSRAEGSGSDA